jgi:hypothetical protein
VLNLARRHLSASSRRGIIKAELLRDATRSDRAIASFVGVSPTTVGAVRRELEQTGRVSKLDSRTSQDGRQRPARASTPRASEPPRETIVKVAVPIELAEQWIGVWVSCRAFRLAERRPGLYELEVQLLDAAAIDDDRVVALTAAAAELGQKPRLRRQRGDRGAPRYGARGVRPRHSDAARPHPAGSGMARRPRRRPRGGKRQVNELEALQRTGRLEELGFVVRSRELAETAKAIRRVPQARRQPRYAPRRGEGRPEEAMILSGGTDRLRRATSSSEALERARDRALGRIRRDVDATAH